jgi:hypothetical protein
MRDIIKQARKHDEESKAFEDVPSVSKRSGPADSLLPTSSGSARRYAHLDATRIVCVFCVAVDHGNSSFGDWNVIFVQNWLPAP